MTAPIGRVRTGARPAVALGLAVVGTGLLVGLTLLIVRADVPLVLLRVSGDDQVNRLVSYQAAVLVGTGVIAASTRRLVPETFSRYFRVGRLGAPAEPVRALGITGTETWKSLGPTFSVVISLVTAAIVLLPAARAGLTLSPSRAGLAVLLAASNAFVEEYLTRFQVVASLAGRVAPARIAVVSAILFGLPHYLGTPGQLAEERLPLFIAASAAWTVRVHPEAAPWGAEIDHSSQGCHRLGPAARTCTTTSRRCVVAGRSGVHVVNRAAPARVPTQRMGEIPVVARVIWDTGAQEWRTAKAVRWTTTHVLVTWRDDPDAPPLGLARHPPLTAAMVRPAVRPIDGRCAGAGHHAATAAS